jgi:hypothetical protein
LRIFNTARFEYLIEKQQLRWSDRNKKFYAVLKYIGCSIEHPIILSK